MKHSTLIDTHQHPVPELYKRAMEKVGISGSGENPWPEWSLQAQLDLMDETGIVAAVNSIASPGCYFGDVDFAVQVARECNEGLAKIVQERPHRFGGVCVAAVAGRSGSDPGGCLRSGYAQARRNLFC